MKIFLDTANLEEIKKYVEWGIVDGVTTNPSLIAKEGVSHEKRIKEICKIVKGPVSAEVIAIDSEGMVKEGRKIAKWAKNVYVKVPMTVDGIKACKILSDEGIKVNVTLIFSSGQALLAAKAGAAFVSPFIGRLDDISEDGLGLIEEISTIFSNYNFKTEILTASVRNPRHVIDAARLGSHIATVPSDVIGKLISHPLTDIGLKKFLDDHKKSL